MPYEIALVILAVVAVVLVSRIILGWRRITIFEYERGLVYTNGRFTKILMPGQHWILTFFTTLLKVDIRPRFISIPGQEVLSADGVSLKVSLAAKYEIADPNVAINKVENYVTGLYLELQMALREVIGLAKIDDLLEKRETLGVKLMELASPKAQELGLKLVSINVKDIMFTGELKKIFAQVVKAQKEGLAILEKARGETAALRNLANAAKLVENNPTLMQLRLLQHLEESSGNTLVLGIPTPTPLPLKNKEVEEQKPPELKAPNVDEE